MHLGPESSLDSNLLFKSEHLAIYTLSTIVENGTNRQQHFLHFIYGNIMADMTYLQPAPRQYVVLELGFHVPAMTISLLFIAFRRYCLQAFICYSDLVLFWHEISKCLAGFHTADENVRAFSNRVSLIYR